MTKTLGINEASKLLRLHPVTLSRRAKSGEIPAAKLGKEWVFILDDLLEYIRVKYKTRALQGERKETQCHFTNAKTLPPGGSKSPSVEKQYNEVLGLTTKSKPRNFMTG